MWKEETAQRIQRALGTLLAQIEAESVDMMKWQLSWQFEETLKGSSERGKVGQGEAMERLCCKR
jgi:DNA-binding transcriptional regulator of glucitol operon